jgi:3-isopropylmalate/(R)-2-methylmalate dehydratase small subunit
MEKFTAHTGTAVPLRRSNVDTDQIIPAEYLKRITRHGYEDALFSKWREDPAFVLNQPQYRGASVLVTGPDFGTGSSREHAVWALQDYGFRVVLSSRFADIFRGNSGKIGLLTAVVPESVVEAIWAEVEADPAVPVTVDLVQRTVTAGAVSGPFEVDDYLRWRLMEGLDDIGITLAHGDAIEAFEAARPAFLPQTLAQPGKSL